MHEPTTGRALGAAMRAVASEAWLSVVGMAVLLGRALLVLPAYAFFSALSALVVAGAVRRGGGLPEVLLSVAGIWGSPRARSIAVGLWLAGMLLWWALRVAWISGALPVLAARMAGSTVPQFSEGFAWRFARVLPAALVSLVLEVAGIAMVASAGVGAWALAGPAVRTGSATAFAFVAASGLASAVFVGALLHVLGDVTVARAAMAGEGPVDALVGAGGAVLRRPWALLVALLAVALATVLGTAAVQLGVGAFPGALRAARVAVLVPEMLLATLSAIVAAGAELWLLAAVGAIALGRQAEPEKRFSSLRSESVGMRPPSQ